MASRRDLRRGAACRAATGFDTEAETMVQLITDQIMAGMKR